MSNKDILKDESLEALGLIREIDTLAIIQKGEKIKEKKRNILSNISAVILTVIILTVNYVIFITLGIKMFIIIQGILSCFIMIMFLPFFKRKLYRRV